MEYNRLKELTAKFWEGKTTEIEEMDLRIYFLNTSNISDEFKDIAAYFELTQNELEQEMLGDDFDDDLMAQISNDAPVKSKTVRRSMFSFYRIAASFLLFAFASIGGYNYFTGTAIDPMEITDTYDDPQKAFDEMKKALMMVSTNLNDGMEYTQEIKKFAQAKNELSN